MNNINQINPNNKKNNDMTNDVTDEKAQHQRSNKNVIRKSS